MVKIRFHSLLLVQTSLVLLTIVEFRSCFTRTNETLAWLLGSWSNQRGCANAMQQVEELHLRDRRKNLYRQCHG